MNLGLIVEDLSADETRTIVAKRPWTANSESRLVSLTDEYRVPSEVLSEGFEYFLEADIALNDVLGELVSRLSTAQQMAAIVYYAENDAYPDWLSAMRQSVRALPSVGLASARSRLSPTAAIA